MAIDPDTFTKVLEIVAVSATSIAGGAVAGNRAARNVKTTLPTDEFSAESARILVERAEARMKEYHDLRDGMNAGFARVAVEAAKLEGRVERSERDISEATARFGLELGKLERMMRDSFREINEKLDGLRGREDTGHKRRLSDRDDGQGSD